MPEDDSDLSFLDLGVAKRRYASPNEDDEQTADGSDDASNQNCWENMARPVRLERTTPSSAS